MSNRFSREFMRSKIHLSFLAVYFIAIGILLAPIHNAWAEASYIDWKPYQEHAQQANIASKKKDYDSVIEHSQYCLEFLRAQTPQDDYLEALLLGMIREAYTESNRLNQAKQILNELINHETKSNFKGIELTLSQASIARQQAEIAAKEGNIDIAIQLYQTAIPLYRQANLGSGYRELQCVEELIDCYQKKNDLKSVVPLKRGAEKLKKFRDLAEDKDYLQKFTNHIGKQIRQRWVPVQSQTSYSVKAGFYLYANGQISDIKIIQSGGSPARDQAAIDALNQATPIDLAKFPAIFFNVRALPIQFTWDYSISTSSTSTFQPSIPRPVATHSRPKTIIRW